MPHATNVANLNFDIAEIILYGDNYSAGVVTFTRNGAMKPKSFTIYGITGTPDLTIAAASTEKIIVFKKDGTFIYVGDSYGNPTGILPMANKRYIVAFDNMMFRIALIEI